jgi:hypothetical protein
MARTREPTRAEIGNDISIIRSDGTLGLDLTFTPITGSRVVVEGVLRVWISARGSMFWAKDRGVNFLTLRNAAHDRMQLELWKMALVNEAKKVDGVRAVTVAFARDETTHTLTIKADIRTMAGTSKLLVGLDEASTILSVAVAAED